MTKYRYGMAATSIEKMIHIVTIMCYQKLIRYCSIINYPLLVSVLFVLFAPSAVSKKLSPIMEAMPAPESSASPSSSVKAAPLSPVSLQFHDVPIRVVLQALADYRQINLVVSDTVATRLTVYLQNVSWPVALETVLHMGNLVAETKENVMMIYSHAELAQRQTQQVVSPSQTTEKKTVKLLPLTTWRIALTHSEAETLANYMNNRTISPLSERGNVIADLRNNTLLVRDEIRHKKVIQQWVDEQDIPVAQVQLTAHIVTMSRDDLREMGVRWGYTNTPLSHSDADISHPQNSLSIEKESGFIGGIQLMRIAGGHLDVALHALERSNQAEIIASPRLLTQHQQMASIKQGVEIPYEVSNGNNGSTSIEFKDAVLGMEVTPTVLSSGKIMLALLITQNVPGRSIKQGDNETLAINKQEIKTQVTVSNGETLILGGIFQQQQNRGQEGIPLLSEIPFIGGVFKNQAHQQERRELLVFITPQLLKR